MQQMCRNRLAHVKRSIHSKVISKYIMDRANLEVWSSLTPFLVGGLGLNDYKIKIKNLTIVHAWCTHDHDWMKIMKMKREEIGMLRPLRDGVGDSSRWILSARRLLLAFFTFFFPLEAQNMDLGFLSSRWGCTWPNFGIEWRWTSLGMLVCH